MHNIIVRQCGYMKGKHQLKVTNLNCRDLIADTERAVTQNIPFAQSSLFSRPLTSRRKLCMYNSKAMTLIEHGEI